MPRFDVSQFNRKGRGRPKGSPNRVDKFTREFFQHFLDRNVDRVQELWEQVSERKPEEALKILLDVSERLVPKLGRQEITGLDGASIVVEVVKQAAQQHQPDPTTWTVT